MGRIGFPVAILLILPVGPLARAAGKEPKEQKAGRAAQERVARKACLSGDYAKGVEILSDLFIDTSDPGYLFNQGRCFEQNSRYQDAIARFREYLRKAPSLNRADRTDVEKHITDCQALLGEKDEATPLRQPNPAPPDPPSPVANPPAAEPAPPPAAPSVGEAAPISAPAQASSAGRGLRIAGIVCGAAGLASVGTGVYFYTRARSLSNTVSHSHPPNPSDEKAGRDAQTMQWVFYGAGTVALAAGVVLYGLGWPSAPGGSSVAGVAPMIGPGLAGISAQGAF